jgi:hypothetical protein
MKATTLVFACFLSATCLLAAPAAGTANLLANPGFADAQKPGQPDGWSLAPGPDGQTTFLVLEKVDGIRAVKITDRNAKSGVGLQQVLPAQAGKRYEASFYLRGGRISLYLDWLDESRKLIKPENMKTFEGLGKKFESFSVDGIAPPAAKYAQIRIYSTSVNETEAWVHTPTLAQVDAAPIAPATGEAPRALVNAAFADTLKPGFPDGWALSPAPDGKTMTIAVETVDGKRAVKIVDRNPKAGVGLSQILAIEGGKTYRAAIRVKGKEVKLYCNWLDANRKLLPPEKIRNAEGGRREFEASELIVRAPEAARFAQYWLYTTTSGETECWVFAPEFGPAPDLPPPAGLPIPVPDRSQLEKRLVQKHPRLFLPPAEQARIKADIATNRAAKKSWGLMSSKAESMLKSEPSKYEIPDGLRLLTTSRRVLDRTLALGLAFRVTGEEKYKERLWRELESAADFPDWNPRHFLDTGEMMHAFAIGYDWLYEEWSPAQRKILSDAVAEKGLKPTFDAYRGKGPNTWWVNGNNNWNFVCNGGASIAALGFWESAPDLCVDVFTNAFRSFQHVMGEFDPDGAWYEGPGYWHYSIKYLVPWFRSMETALGTNFGVLGAFKSFAQTPDFPVLLTGPSGQSFNFADAGSGKVGTLPELFWFARHLRNPLWQAFETERLAGAPEELLYFDVSMDGRAVAGVPMDRLFRSTEVAVLRSDWGSNALWVGLKAGANGVNHFHYDLGSFVLDAGGARFVEDLGAEWQTYVSYKHSFKHHEFYRIRPEGHNTLVINPGKESGQSKDALTTIGAFTSQPDGAFASVDLSRAYRNDAVRVARKVALIHQRKAAEISDEIECDEPSVLWWFAHTKAQISIAADGRTANLTLPQADLKAEIVEPANGRFLSMAAAPLPSSPNPDIQNKNGGLRKLAIVLSNTLKMRVVVRFTPGPARDKKVVGPASLGADFKPVLEKGVRVEAESFSGEEGGTVELTDKVANSGRSFKGWDNPGHALSWKVNAPAAGEYGLLVRYCTAAEEALRKVRVDGKDVSTETYSFLGTGGYSGSSDDWKEVFAANRAGGLRLNLSAGEHTLTLINVAEPMNLDWIKLVPLTK